MTKSDPYAELFHAMAKEPVIPAGLSRNRTGEAIRETFGNDLVQIGADVGRLVDRLNDPYSSRDIMGNPYHPPACGEVGNVMPEVADPAADTMLAHYGIVQARYGMAYCAMAIADKAIKPYLIIVPDGNSDTGSTILTIAPSQPQAWKQAAELCER